MNWLLDKVSSLQLSQQQQQTSAETAGQPQSDSTIPHDHTHTETDTEAAAAADSDNAAVATDSAAADQDNCDAGCQSYSPSPSPSCSLILDPHHTAANGAAIGCSVPCSVHPNIPSSLLSKIDFAVDGEFSCSVSPYVSHLCILVPLAADRWPSKIESMEFIKQFADELAAVEPNQRGIKYSARLSAAEADADSDAVASAEFSCADILLFPEQIRFKQIQRSQISGFIKHIAARQQANAQSQSAVAASSESESKSADPVTAAAAASAAVAVSLFSGSVVSSRNELALEVASPASETKFESIAAAGNWFLICCHKLRDKRCGVIGQLIAGEFERIIQDERIENASVLRISHIGGHRWAGTLIHYPSGVWFGRLKPCHVPLIIKATVGNDGRVKELLAPLVRGKIESNLNW